jgi:hypothetical protein
VRCGRWNLAHPAANSEAEGRTSGRKRTTAVLGGIGCHCPVKDGHAKCVRRLNAILEHASNTDIPPDSRAHGRGPGENWQALASHRVKRRLGCTAIPRRLGDRAACQTRPADVRANSHHQLGPRRGDIGPGRMHCRSHLGDTGCLNRRRGQ